MVSQENRIYFIHYKISKSKLATDHFMIISHKLLNNRVHNVQIQPERGNQFDNSRKRSIAPEMEYAVEIINRYCLKIIFFLFCPEQGESS